MNGIALDVDAGKMYWAEFFAHRIRRANLDGSDVDASGDVGISDLLAMIAAWGPCCACREDLDESGEVGMTDLLTLLANWGRCA